MTRRPKCSYCNRPALLRFRLWKEEKDKGWTSKCIRACKDHFKTLEHEWGLWEDKDIEVWDGFGFVTFQEYVDHIVALDSPNVRNLFTGQTPLQVLKSLNPDSPKWESYDALLPYVRIFLGIQRGNE